MLQSQITALYVGHQQRTYGVTDMSIITIHEVRETYGSDFYVYSGDKLIRVCPSIGMAREVAAAYS
jgi:hypothetical protein